MRSYIIIITFFFLIVGQETNAQTSKIIPARTTLTNVFKHPESFLTFYYPRYLQMENGVIDTRLDTFRIEYFSTNLHCFDEKVLFNSKSEDEVYRFLLLRSFNLPILILIKKSSGKVFLTYKMLDRRPEWQVSLYGLHPPYKSPVIVDSIETDNNIENEKYVPKIDSIHMPKRFAKIIVNETKELDINTWNNFIILLKKYDFWNQKPTLESYGLDGESWVLEGFKDYKYRFVYRWSPKDSLRVCGEYLLKISNLKIEEK